MGRKDDDGEKKIADQIALNHEHQAKPLKIRRVEFEHHFLLNIRKSCLRFGFGPSFTTGFEPSLFSSLLSPISFFFMKQA